MVSSAAFGAGWDGSYGRDSDGGSLQQKIELLRQKVKYVFVIFHENESFNLWLGLSFGGTIFMARSAINQPSSV